MKYGGGGIKASWKSIPPFLLFLLSSSFWFWNMWDWRGTRWACWGRGVPDPYHSQPRVTKYCQGRVGTSCSSQPGVSVVQCGKDDCYSVGFNRGLLTALWLPRANQLAEVQLVSLPPAMKDMGIHELALSTSQKKRGRHLHPREGRCISIWEGDTASPSWRGMLRLHPKEGHYLYPREGCCMPTGHFIGLIN